MAVDRDTIDGLVRLSVIHRLIDALVKVSMVRLMMASGAGFAPAKTARNRVMREILGVRNAVRQHLAGSAH